MCFVLWNIFIRKLQILVPNFGGNVRQMTTKNVGNTLECSRWSFSSDESIFPRDRALKHNLWIRKTQRHLEGQWELHTVDPGGTGRKHCLIRRPRQCQYHHFHERHRCAQKVLREVQNISTHTCSDLRGPEDPARVSEVWIGLMF